MESGPSAQGWRLPIAITVCASVFTAMQGLSYPLLTLILNRLGEPEWIIGVNASMTPLGMIIAAVLAPRLIRRLGGLPLVMLGLLGAAITFLAIGAYHDALIWMPLRLGMGVCLGCLLVITETWINEVAADARRGRVLGFYSAVLSVGFALGPALLALVGSEGWTPFVLGALFPILALLPLLAVRPALPRRTSEDEALSIFSFLPMAPLLLACAAAVAFADEGAMSLLPVFLLQHGYGGQAGSVALVVMIVGSVSMQYPIGWLADRLSRSAVMAGCALAAAASTALLPLAVAAPMLLGALIFIWGGSYYAVYMLSLVRLGGTFKGATLVAGNAAFAAMWGIGGIAGPSIVGGAMSFLGPIGLPLVFMAVFAGIAVALMAPAERRSDAAAG